MKLRPLTRKAIEMSNAPMIAPRCPRAAHDFQGAGQGSGGASLVEASTRCPRGASLPIAGKAVYNNNAGYAMTKFAAVALSHAARRAGWEDGVRCTALCPGFVATDMTADVETFPHEQMMAPGDIAEVVLTVLGLSNNASIAELVINCRDDVTM